MRMIGWADGRVLDGRVLWLAVAVVATQLAVPRWAWSQRTVRLVERLEVRGVLESVRPGLLEIRPADGPLLACKIQERDQSSVALNGATIRFPAQVSVSGELAVDQLATGGQVRLRARINRLGSGQDEVRELQLLDAAESDKSGVKPLEEAAGSKPVECDIQGAIQTLRGRRLMLRVPVGDYLRRDRVTVLLADEARVLVRSQEHTRASAGDVVESARIARFDTGDLVVESLQIKLGAREGQPEVDPAEARYARFSDEPSAPRDVRSAHFVLHTDVSDRQAQRLLDRLETMVGLVSTYFARPPRGIIECYVVRDLSQWPADALPAQALAKIRGSAGVTIRSSVGGSPRAIVYACDRAGVVQHEAVHAYCGQTFGSTGPTWYSEGMAELGNYWQRDAPGVSVPPVVLNHLRQLPPKSLGEIVRAGQVTGDSWQAYAWRWALCYLLANNPNYAPRFKALGVAMMSGQAGVSFESVYGPLATEISFEYDFFVRHLDNGLRADLCAWDWSCKFRPLGPEQREQVRVLARRGWQPTGVSLEAGTSYDFAAVGEWAVAEGGSPCNADGLQDGRGRLTAVLLTAGKLGEPFRLGTRGQFRPEQAGHLYVRCGDHWPRLDDNSGELTLHLRVTPQTQPDSAGKEPPRAAEPPSPQPATPPSRGR